LGRKRVLVEYIVEDFGEDHNGNKKVNTHDDEK
jgi:hypothetical protein